MRDERCTLASIVLNPRRFEALLVDFDSDYSGVSILAADGHILTDWPVRQLWPPSGGNQNTELDVVLFHGLQVTANDSSDAWSSTWTQRGHADVCWPQGWLPFDLGEEAVRIFSVSYNAHVVTSPHDHVSEIAHNLFQTLMNSRYEWHHPIVLIGHSFGGLVLKSLVVKLKKESTIQNSTNPFSKATVQRAKVFLSNVRGVAFYAVPHAGSSNFTEYVNKLLRCYNKHHRGIMYNIRPWQRDMEQLSVDFDCIVTENEISIYAFCEGRPMEQVGILVDFSSAQRSAGDNCYKVEDANHMEVCKPPSKEHPSYDLLLQFIITCGKERECDEASQEVHDLPESTFGLESYVERVETLLTSEGKNAAPRYVGVWGMGGVGKTLLLQRVYGSRKVHGHFQGAKFVWLTVGQTPDIMALYRTLSAQLGFEPEKTANPEDYKFKLYNQFRQRRVFLALDDVWQDKAFDSLDLAKGKGSVTLLSTRNLPLLERASPHIRQEHMTPLSEDDSWSLFCVHAFTPPSNVPCELKALAQSMAEECQGLPLALKVIGRAMFGKTSRELQWEPLLKKLRESRMQERNVEEGLYERLKVGYDLLSEDDQRLKDCFLYFAAFPEDSKAEFHDILWGWIGEVLIPGNGGDDPRADAFSLLNKLWRRSFIESNLGDGDIEVEELWFKLHDVMRDLAFYILEKDSGTPPAKQLYLYGAGQYLEEFPQEWEVILKAQRLSLQFNNLTRLPERRICAPELLSLLLTWNPIVLVPGSFLSSFQKLRVLDLSGGDFWYLPEELGDLKHLVWLELSNCENLETLPDAVRKLHMLKHLNLLECVSLKYLPSGIVGLTSLEDLCTISCLKLIWAKHTASGMAVPQSLCDISPTVGASLEDIGGCAVLTNLRISGKIDRGMELPHNISALTNLKILELRLVNVKTLPAGMAYSLKQLQELRLYEVRSLEYLPRSFTSRDAFPALTYFSLMLCSSLVEFPEVDEGALPNLRTLAFVGCGSLGTLPLSLELLSSLREVYVHCCGETVKDSCRINCEKSSIWRTLDISHAFGRL
ncbi:unnamed protein product [Sphagnum jensenii]|uniref:NB-ARC domain-containing protein n=1 Tax=Sphagnum jensenii TaxID=128206 RepID=A0ABP1BLR6_9BRYO